MIPLSIEPADNIDNNIKHRPDQKDDYFLSQFHFSVATHIALGTYGMPTLLLL